MIEVIHTIESTFAGVRRHVIDLVTELADLGVQQAVVYSPLRADASFRMAMPELTKKGVAFIELPIPRDVHPLRDARAIRQLRRIVKNIGPRIVHAHSGKAGGVSRLATLGLRGVKTLYTPNASPAHMGTTYLWLERALGRLNTSAIIAVSRSEQEEIRNLRLTAAEKCVHISSGISCAEAQNLAKASAQSALGDAPLTVVAAGRLVAQKNPGVLVDASAVLAKQFPGISFVWIGDGEQRSLMEQQIRRSELSGAWSITGWVSNPMPLIQTATVFVVPSDYESFGYVTLEAMCLGRPVVVTDVAGSRDLVVHGETGLVVPRRDPDALATAIAVILGDKSVAASMGAAGKARSRMFDRHAMALETLSLYHRLGLPPGSDVVDSSRPHR